MAVSRLTPSAGNPVDEGWDLDESPAASPSLKLVDVAGELQTDDAWPLSSEPAPTSEPRLEVVASKGSAVPRPIHDDGWGLADDAGALTDEEAAFFARGEALTEQEPPDTFEDLAEQRGTLWDRIGRWWRRG